MSTCADCADGKQQEKGSPPRFDSLLRRPQSPRSSRWCTGRDLFSQTAEENTSRVSQLQSTAISFHTLCLFSSAFTSDRFLHQYSQHQGSSAALLGMQKMACEAVMPCRPKCVKMNLGAKGSCGKLRASLKHLRIIMT